MKDVRENNNFMARVIQVLVIVAAIVTAAWAVDDRTEKKIDPLRAQMRIIVDMRESLARIEERVNAIEKKDPADCNCSTRHR